MRKVIGLILVLGFTTTTAWSSDCLRELDEFFSRDRGGQAAQLFSGANPKLMHRLIGSPIYMVFRKQLVQDLVEQQPRLSQIKPIFESLNDTKTIIQLLDVFSDPQLFEKAIDDPKQIALFRTLVEVMIWEAVVLNPARERMIMAKAHRQAINGYQYTNPEGMKIDGGPIYNESEKAIINFRHLQHELTARSDTLFFPVPWVEPHQKVRGGVLQGLTLTFTLHVKCSQSLNKQCDHVVQRFNTIAQKIWSRDSIWIKGAYHRVEVNVIKAEKDDEDVIHLDIYRPGINGQIDNTTYLEGWHYIAQKVYLPAILLQSDVSSFGEGYIAHQMGHWLGIFDSQYFVIDNHDDTGTLVPCYVKMKQTYGEHNPFEIMDASLHKFFETWNIPPVALPQRELKSMELYGNHENLRRIYKLLVKAFPNYTHLIPKNLQQAFTDKPTLNQNDKTPSAPRNRGDDNQPTATSNYGPKRLIAVPEQGLTLLAKHYHPWLRTEQEQAAWRLVYPDIIERAYKALADYFEVQQNGK